MEQSSFKQAIDAKLASIQEKINIINQQKTKYLQHIQTLSKENKKLKKQLAESIHHQKMTEQKIQVLQLGVPKLNREEKIKLKQSIDNFLKEIDQCIHLIQR